MKHAGISKIRAYLPGYESEKHRHLSLSLFLPLSRLSRAWPGPGGLFNSFESCGTSFRKVAKVPMTTSLQYPYHQPIPLVNQVEAIVGSAFCD